MLAVLLHPVYARLFAAQVVALLGTGLLTIALGLLAFDLAGERAGAVLGAAFAIKMVAYVGLAPVAAALAARLPRKAVLIGADTVRGATALLLPFVDAVWQIYVLIFVLQAASAAFTPAFQATIPDVLEDEGAYTRALSLSRLAYDLENLVSPALAALLLTLVGYHVLFAGTALGFAASALLVLSAALPPRRAVRERGFAERLTRGARIYLATPRLRALLALTMTAAAASGFVLVNTVVIVRETYLGAEGDVAAAYAAYGAGSMIAALALPRLLEKRADRPVMIAAGLALALLTLGLAGWLARGPTPGWAAFLTLWAALGLLYSAILTPAGRLLRRSARKEDRPDVFAAQFALSHVCWLIAYPLAGWVGAGFGMAAALGVLGALGLAGALAAIRLWPVGDDAPLIHEHPDLPQDHPHMTANQTAAHRHAHRYIIDDEHRIWPSQG